MLRILRGSVLPIQCMHRRVRTDSHVVYHTSEPPPQQPQHNNNTTTNTPPPQHHHLHNNNHHHNHHNNKTTTPPPQQTHNTTHNTTQHHTTPHTPPHNTTQHHTTPHQAPTIHHPSHPLWTMSKKVNSNTEELRLKERLSRIKSLYRAVTEVRLISRRNGGRQLMEVTRQALGVTPLISR